MAENKKDYAALKTEVLEMLDRTRNKAMQVHTLICADTLLGLACSLEDAARDVFQTVEDMVQVSKLLDLVGDLQTDIRGDALETEDLEELLEGDIENLPDDFDYGYLLEDDDDEGEEPADGLLAAGVEAGADE